MNKLLLALGAACLVTAPSWAARDDEPIKVPASLTRPPTEQEEGDMSPVPPQPNLTPEERSAIDRETSPLPQNAAQEEQHRHAIDSMNKDCQAVDQQVTAFAQVAGIKNPPSQLSPADVELQTAPTIKPGPDDMIITCDGGCYIDQEAGLIVYMDNVKLRHPQYYLDCTKQLKVFLAKDSQPKQTDPTKKDDKADRSLGQFSGVEKIIALGNVTVKYTDEEGKITTAHGDRMLHNMKTDETIIIGGYPYVDSAEHGRIQSTDKNGFIRKEGNATTVHGANETIGRNLKSLNDSSKSKK